MHIFFRKPFFDTLTNCQKNIFTPLHTICVFLRYPKKHYKTGENKQKKILDQVLTQPWTKFWLKKTQILDQVLTLQHIYIYVSLSLSLPLLLGWHLWLRNEASWLHIKHPRCFWRTAGHLGWLRGPAAMQVTNLPCCAILVAIVPQNYSVLVFWAGAGNRTIIAWYAAKWVSHRGTCAVLFSLIFLILSKENLNYYFLFIYYQGFSVAAKPTEF